MSSIRTYSATIVGITGHILAIDAETGPGLPVTLLYGFPPATWREQRDRVRAAVVNSGFDWPAGEMTISAKPWSLPKHGGADLALAVAALAANHDVPADKLKAALFYAGLDSYGRLCAIPGTVPVLQAAAARHQFTTVILADGDPAEATPVAGVRVITATHLDQVIRWLRGAPPPAMRHVTPLARAVPDRADLHLPARVRTAVEIAAAGAHHLSLLDGRGHVATTLALRRTSCRASMMRPRWTSPLSARPPDC